MRQAPGAVFHEGRACFGFGCDEETKGGTFRPGHDQRLRSAIEGAVGGLESLRSMAETHLGPPISAEPKR